MERAGQIALFLLTAMFSLEGWGWGAKWKVREWKDRVEQQLAFLPVLDIIWLFIERLFC